MPVEQEIVVVEDRGGLLAVDVGVEKPPQLLGPLVAPRELRGQDLGQRLPRVDAAAVDVEARPLFGEAAVGLGQPKLRAQHVEEILGIGPVVDREAAVQADRLAVAPQEPGGNGVERPTPDPGAGRAEGGGGGPGIVQLAQHTIHPAEHLRGGPPREGHQQDPSGLNPLGDEPGDAVDQGRGLAGSGPGHDQERSIAVLGGLPLLGVKAGEDFVDRMGLVHR